MKRRHREDEGRDERAIDRFAHRAGDLVEDAVELAAQGLDVIEDAFERRRARRRHEGGEGGGQHPAPCGGRPAKDPGTSRGQTGGTPLTPGDVASDPPWTSWPGPRKDLDSPMLVMRANPGDTGTRPVVGPFWESPDIFIAAGVKPSDAPEIPAHLGDTAKAGEHNTVYAHVWNAGRGAAKFVVVEFWWADPSIGINPLGLTPIGQTVTWLDDRYGARSHKVVKCPESWDARYVNGGHECLVVRIYDLCSSDGLVAPVWDASQNRHVAQRNVHVIAAADLAAQPPITLQVGPLFGAPALVAVARAVPIEMPWLQLRAGRRGVFPAPAPAGAGPVLGTPQPLGHATGGGAATARTVNGDDQGVAFATGDGAPGAGQAHVYRVTGEQGGTLFGGYTVVVAG